MVIDLFVYDEGFSYYKKVLKVICPNHKNSSFINQTN